MPWNVDPAHSSVGFGVRHMVMSTVRGQFKDYAVAAEVDENDLSRSTATVTIQAASVDTGAADRDAHLRSGDFFDVENYPVITFATKRLEPKRDGDYRLIGDLTIRGVTREVALDAEVTAPLKDPWGNTKAGLSAEGKINRKDFGLGWNAVLEAGGLVVADTVKLAIDLELAKAA
ncbi:MAG: YceI family protein [Chloroflexi bacterium]|nr:YceI family protein [Chloroflexota bacterium]